MYGYVRQRLWVSLFLIIGLVSLPMFADDVTISGNVNFSSLDGSALDHDGAANGVFTVDDGNLTVLGTINCLDDGAGGNSACAMSFAVSGNLTMAPGSAMFAENRTGGGTGGNITLNVGGNVSLQSSGSSTNGAVISSGNDGNDAAGSITMNVGGTSTFAAGTTISAASKGGNAGAIAVNSGGAITANGLIASAPTRVLNAARYTGDVTNGGSSNAKGGTISLVSTSNSEPGVVIGGTGTVVSQGENSGSSRVLLEGCGVEIRGLVASLSDGSGSAVTVRSGTTLLVDGRDLFGVPVSARYGMIRVDATSNSAASYKVDLFAGAGIQVLGPSAASPFFSINSNAVSNNSTGGSIRVISVDSTVTASGNAFNASASGNSSAGGSINVAAKGDVTLDGATLKASGAANGKGGSIAARSYSGGVSWQTGVGDARPTGSGVAAANRGSIALTYCTTVATSGSSFPTNGAAVGTYPSTTNTCSPSAPALPAGETLPDCNDAPVAVNDAYNVNEGGTLNVTAPGVLGNDTDADGDPITATLVSGPSNASSFTFNADGSFSYTHNGGETTSDSFTYTATDGSLTSNTATVTITINPVNDAPVAVDDAYDVNEGGTLNVAAPGVLVNDTDPDSSLTAVLVSGPANASSFTLNPNGSFSYTHNGTETTSDSFTYKANDGSIDSNVATVTITINPVNDAPVANNDGPYSVPFHGSITQPAPGVLLNDTDAENDGLIAVLVTNVTQGTLALNADGSFTYNHTGPTLGTDSFTYVAQDTSGAQSAPATVTINIINLAPTPANDSFTGVGNTELRVGTGSAAHPAAVVSGSVLANDTDPDAGPSPLIVTAFDATSANGGTVSMNPDGTFNYLPATGFVGVDTFNYTVSDGSASAVATVTITSTERVWYVNPTASGPQTGRSTDPFMTIGQAQGASSINDYIHVAQGAQTTGILLKNGQRLIGSGVALVVGPYTLAGATVRPTLAGTVTLANGNLVTGVNITPLGAGISANAVSNGTIAEVGITGGSDGITFTTAGGTFTLTNVTVAPAGNGIVINGSSAAITANNVSVTTTGFTGISGNGTGALTFNGGSVSSTNATAVSLSNHTLAGTGLTSVSSSGATNGIVLNTTGGTFRVVGTGAAGSGGTITGTSGVAVSVVNAAGVSLKSMNINNAGLQGVFATSNVATASLVEVRDSSFTGNFSNAVQTINSGTGVQSVTVSGNTFTNNNSALVVQTTSGGVIAKVTNNTSTFNQSNAFNIARSVGATGAVDATVTGNVIGTVGVLGSGASCGGGCNGIQVVAAGSNTFNLLLSANTVRQVDSVGIRVFAQQGSSALNATITNNVVEDASPDAAIGIQVQSGAVSADTTAVCASITGNTVTGGYGIDIFVRNNSAGSTFNLPGYAGLGTDLTAVQNFIKANNTVTTVLAQRKTTAPANQYSGGSPCPTPAP